MNLSEESVTSEPGSPARLLYYHFLMNCEDIQPPPSKRIKLSPDMTTMTTCRKNLLPLFNACPREEDAEQDLRRDPSRFIDEDCAGTHLSQTHDTAYLGVDFDPFEVEGLQDLYGWDPANGHLLTDFDLDILLQHDVRPSSEDISELPESENNTIYVDTAPVDNQLLSLVPLSPEIPYPDLPQELLYDWVTFPWDVLTPPGPSTCESPSMEYIFPSIYDQSVQDMWQPLYPGQLVVPNMQYGFSSFTGLENTTGMNQPFYPGQPVVSNMQYGFPSFTGLVNTTGMNQHLYQGVFLVSELMVPSIQYGFPSFTGLDNTIGMNQPLYPGELVVPDMQYGFPSFTGLQNTTGMNQPLYPGEEVPGMAPSSPCLSKSMEDLYRLIDEGDFVENISDENS